MLLATQRELNDVLWECLDFCSEAHSPDQALDSFVKKLRRNGQWSRREVDELESTARLLVAGPATLR